MSISTQGRADTGSLLKQLVIFALYPSFISSVIQRAKKKKKFIEHLLCVRHLTGNQGNSDGPAGMIPAFVELIVGGSRDV